MRSKWRTDTTRSFPKNIVWTESIPDDASNMVTVAVLFEDQGDETNLILHTSAEQKDMTEKGGMLMVYDMVLDGFTEFLKGLV